MNIVLVCERFDPAGGGLEQWAVEWVGRMRQRGHAMQVLTFHNGATAQDGVAIRVLPWVASRRARAAAAEAELRDMAAHIVHDLGVGCRCNVLHPQGGSRLAGLERDAASRSWAERWRRALDPRFWHWRSEWIAIERHQYSRHQSVVIAVSDKVARELERHHGWPRERTRLAPNGVDVERFSPNVRAQQRHQMRSRLGYHDNQTVFLFAAHNPRLKGIRPLLQALSRVHKVHPQVRLLVIGTAPEAALQDSVGRLGLGAVVRFEGFVPDPLSYYAAADGFVLPSYYDACSLTILEAAACGLPVVTTRDNGAAELFTHGLDGFILESADDVDTLAKVMLDLLDPTERCRVADPARAVAVAHDIHHQVETIEKIYQETLQRWPWSRHP